jgi:hypothetical protein
VPTLVPKGPIRVPNFCVYYTTRTVRVHDSRTKLPTPLTAFLDILFGRDYVHIGNDVAV